MNDWSLIAVALAGLVSGAIIGLNMGTEFEYRVRGSTEPLLTLFSNNSPLGVLFNQILLILLVIVSVPFSAVLIMRIGGAYPLSAIDKYTFTLVLIISTAASKYLRYRYWRRRSSRLL